MRTPLPALWRRLPPRNRRALAVAGTALALGLTWAVALRPALQTLRTAPAERQRAEQQWHATRALADAAQALRTEPPPSATDRATTLLALSRASATTLGAGASAQPQPDRVVVALDGVSPEALAQWLLQVRDSARLLPLEAQLQRGAHGWAGSVVLVGPGLSQP